MLKFTELLTSIPPEIEFSDDFRENRSYVIHLNSLNIRSKIWRGILGQVSWKMYSHSTNPIIYLNQISHYLTGEGVLNHHMYLVSFLTLDIRCFCWGQDKFKNVSKNFLVKFDVERLMNWILRLIWFRKCSLRKWYFNFFWHQIFAEFNRKKIE